MKERARMICDDREVARRIAESSLVGVVRVMVKGKRVFVEAEAPASLERVSECKTSISVREPYEEALYS